MVDETEFEKFTKHLRSLEDETCTRFKDMIDNKIVRSPLHAVLVLEFLKTHIEHNIPYLMEQIEQGMPNGSKEIALKLREFIATAKSTQKKVEVSFCSKK